jgi:5-oxoprolinase (ATP-hydrolysing)
VKVFFRRWHDASSIRASNFRPAKVLGPAIIVEPHQTIVVEDGWRAEITAKNHLTLTRVVAVKRQTRSAPKADPVMLEVFNNLHVHRRADGCGAAKHRLLGQHQGTA